MIQFVSVGINNANIYKAYDYQVPPELAEQVEPGCLVEVPFGKQIAQGVVLAVLAKPEVADTLPIRAVLSAGTLLTAQQMQLASWLAENSFAALGACISLMIPDGFSRRATTQVWLNENAFIPEGLGTTETRLIKVLQKRGALRSGQLDRALPKHNWRKAASQLQSLGLISQRNFLPPPGVSPKTVRTAQLSIAPEEIGLLEAGSFGKTEAVIARRNQVLRLLASDPFPVDFSQIPEIIRCRVWNNRDFCCHQFSCFQADDHNQNTE